MSQPLRNDRADVAYYGFSRENVLALLPKPLGAVLDVGCGAGATADPLRALGATRIVGVEFVAEQAAIAAERFDECHAAAIEDALPELDEAFDTVLCLDVLEHLVDPYSVLAGLRRVTKPSGHLQISVPNARHKDLVLDLVLRGSFRYSDAGPRDWTHLRWFTRRDLHAALERAGWTVTASGESALNPKAKLVERICGRRTREFFAIQLYVGATPATG